MLKRMMFSLLGAATLGVLLSVGPSVMAACQGWCADRILYQGQELDYAGCTLSYNSQDQVDGVTCFYTG
jgi:hypothetical protein